MCTDVSGLRGIRRNRGLVTFAKNPQYRLSLPRPTTTLRGYPLNPSTLGEHIRKRRIELRLLQIEAAAEIGVTESTVWNWEHGTQPELRYMPKIIRFLGYAPFNCPEDTIEKLNYFKTVRGLSYERLGSLMGRSPEQLTDWITRRHKPHACSLRDIENFLSQESDQEDK